MRGILSEVMKERRTKGVTENDLLGCLMDSRDERGEHLNDDQIADNIIGVLFAAQDTTASVMTWVLKFLHDHPKLLESVRVRTPKHRVMISSRTNLLAGTLIGPRHRFHVGGANGDPAEQRVWKSTPDMGANAKHGSNSQGE